MGGARHQGGCEGAVHGVRCWLCAPGVAGSGVWRANVCARAACLLLGGLWVAQGPVFMGGERERACAGNIDFLAWLASAAVCRPLAGAGGGARGLLTG